MRMPSGNCGSPISFPYASTGGRKTDRDIMASAACYLQGAFGVTTAAAEVGWIARRAEMRAFLDDAYEKLNRPAGAR